MAAETLLSNVNIPAEQLHPIPVRGSDPLQSAEAYEEHLRWFWSKFKKGSTHQPGGPGSGRFPCFDLVLLGVGTDGHTASLFPGDRALLETRRWVTAVSHPKGNPPVPRVTLTLPVINASHTVMILVSGRTKQTLVKKILGGDEESLAQYPIAMVKPRSKLLWLIQGAET